MSARWLREGRSNASAAAGAEPSKRRLVSPLGQGEALSRWLQLARRGQLPHGFLVEGPRGGGKTTVIEYFTAALLCPSDLDPDGPCGVCRTCSRIANGLHPDVHLLDLAQDEADKKAWKKSFYVVTVEQVRRAQEELQRHAIEGRARVLVIADADCLGEEGQNALLKTLEEPGLATFLLLEATRPENLLPTVHSRVQRLRVRPLDEGTITRELSARMPNQSARFPTALALAAGSLGAALEACTEHAVQIHDLVLGMLAEPDRLRPVAITRTVLATSSEPRLHGDSVRSFLRTLRACLRQQRDALAAAATATYPDSCAEPWTTWLELTLAAERDLDLMIPPEQVLTACLVSFAGN